MWEEELLDEMLVLLGAEPLLMDKEDEWLWGMDASGLYTTKSASLFLNEKATAEQSVSSYGNMVFNMLWRCKAPPKILTFTWQVLRDRIPSKENLFKRGAVIPQMEQNCVLCHDYIESTEHLFPSCRMAHNIWSKVYGWIDISGVQPLNLREHFLQHRGLFKGKKMES